MTSKVFICSVCEDTKTFPKTSTAKTHANDKHPHMFWLCPTKNCKYFVNKKGSEAAHECVLNAAEVAVVKKTTADESAKRRKGGISRY